MNRGRLEILAYEESPLGPLCLRRRALLGDPGTVVTEITLNHEFLMSSHHTDSERALAKEAAAFHVAGGADRRVLVGGLGLGYTAHAALECERVADVEVIELLPEVVSWLRDGLVPLSDALNADVRFRPVVGDVYARLDGEPEGPPYDIILIDVDHSPDERLGGSNASFYSADGLRRARRHLAPGGVLGVWSYAESSPFADALRDVFDEVRVVPVRFMNVMVGEENEDWLFFAK